MAKAAFVGFGEVNTPIDIIVNKCAAAEAALKKEGLDLVSVYPVTDDYEEKDIQKAYAALEGHEFDCLVVCIAGWIPTHAVVKITEKYRHLPIVLWGLCGWMEDGRIVTTADQAGTTALRKTFKDLGYTFKYIYDVIGKPSKSKKVADYAKAASAAKLCLPSRRKFPSWVTAGTAGRRWRMQLVRRKVLSAGIAAAAMLMKPRQLPS